MSSSSKQMHSSRHAANSYNHAGGSAHAPQPSTGIQFSIILPCPDTHIHDSRLGLLRRVTSDEFDRIFAVELEKAAETEGAVCATSTVYPNIF